MSEARRSIVITVRRPRTFSTSSDTSISKTPFFKRMPHLKRILNKKTRKPSHSSLNKYSIPDHEPLQVMSLKEELLLSYRLYAKKQERLRHLQKLQINLIKKYKIMYTDLRRRLYVEDPPDDVYAITDIDKSYYHYLSGRPLAKYIPTYKSLQHEYNDGLRIRQEIGYRRDDILNIESNYRNEVKEYDDCLERYKEQVKLFDQFISEDYTKSMHFLKKGEDMKIQVSKVLIQQGILASEEFTIVSRLIGLDYSYSLQQKYGRFLYYLSPPSWRAKHREFARSIEIEAKGFDLGISSEEDSFNQIFEKMQQICAGGLIKPPLYFEDPSQIMDLFEGIEQQQLHHFSYVNHLAPHAETIKQDINSLKESMVHDTVIVTHMIKRFEKLLEFLEEKEAFLRNKFMKIIYTGMFFDSVGAIDVLKLKLHLDFCYEKLYSDTPTNINMFNVAKAIEEFYMIYSGKMDGLLNGKIKLASKHLIETGKAKLKRAKNAAKELRAFKRVERELLHAFEPVRQTNRQTALAYKQPTMVRSNQNVTQVVPGRSIASTNYNLTDAENEYLTLFTEWTDTEDPGNYLQCLKLDSRRSTN